MHIIRVALQVDTCALISTCLPASRCGETRETTTWTLPSLCSETLRLDSWVRRLFLRRPIRGIHRTLLLQLIHKTSLPVGEALLESNTVIDFVYCSPSLRCVQTAQNILKGESRWSSSTFTCILSPFCQMRDVLCDISCPCRSAAGRQVEGESGAGSLWMDQVGLWEFFACVDSSHWARRR